MNKRLFYLDFVRTIAVFLIIVTHYNAAFVFYNNPPMYEKCILFEMPFNIYIGNLGVSLFLIISGCSLMYVYNEKCEIFSFYKKRFLSIFPMFWLAYLSIFLLKFYLEKGVDQTIPKWKIIYSILGMAGYLSEYGVNFYILGEWFLGFIIIFYIIFPFLRYVLDKFEKLTLIIICLVYIITLLTYNLQLDVSKCILIRLPELVFGMCFIKNEMKVSKLLFIGALLVLIVNAYFKPNFYASIQTTYIGIAAFISLVYLSKFFECNFMYNLCKQVSKYSYAIFLVHHVIITYIQSGFDLMEISDFENILLFVGCNFVIMVFAIYLNKSDQFVKNKLGYICKTNN